MEGGGQVERETDIEEPEFGKRLLSFVRTGRGARR
jgi:hypothetical protein